MACTFASRLISVFHTCIPLIMSALEKEKSVLVTLKHRFSVKFWICLDKWNRTHFIFAATTSALPFLFSPRYFSARRRLQNDKFSTLKKDFRCLRGTFCAALSFRLLFASLISFLPLSLRFLSSLSHPSLSFSLFHSLSLFFSFLTYLLSFLARSLHPLFSLSPSIHRCCTSPSVSSLQIYNALACNKRLCASFTIMSSLQVPRGLIELRPFRSAGLRR